MYVVYTDGASAVHTTRCGGAAALVIRPDGTRDLLKFHACATTSNRMELSGVILGLTATPPHVEIEVKTDSQYVVQGIAGNWKLKLNLDLWEILRVLVADRKVTFTWIPRNSEAGHASVDGAANRISKECPKKA